MEFIVRNFFFLEETKINLFSQFLMMCKNEDLLPVVHRNWKTDLKYFSVIKI